MSRIAAIGEDDEVRLGELANHMLQDEAIQKTMRTVLRALEESFDESISAKWKTYLRRHLEHISFEGVEFNAYNPEELFKEAVKRVIRAEILYPRTRHTRDTSVCPFVLTVGQLLKLTRCEFIYKREEAREEKRKERDELLRTWYSISRAVQRDLPEDEIIDLSKKPIRISTVLAWKHCSRLSTECLAKLLTDPSLHRQVLYQLRNPDLGPFEQPGLFEGERSEVGKLLLVLPKRTGFA